MLKTSFLPCPKCGHVDEVQFAGLPRYAPREGDPPATHTCSACGLVVMVRNPRQAAYDKMSSANPNYWDLMFNANLRGWAQGFLAAQPAPSKGFARELFTSKAEMNEVSWEIELHHIREGIATADPKRVVCRDAHGHTCRLARLTVGMLTIDSVNVFGAGEIEFWGSSELSASGCFLFRHEATVRARERTMWGRVRYKAPRFGTSVMVDTIEGRELRHDFDPAAGTWTPPDPFKAPMDYLCEWCGARMTEHARMQPDPPREVRTLVCPACGACEPWERRDLLQAVGRGTDLNAELRDMWARLEAADDDAASVVAALSLSADAVEQLRASSSGWSAAEAKALDQLLEAARAAEAAQE